MRTAGAVLLGILLSEALLRLLGVSHPVWDRPTSGVGEFGLAHARGWWDVEGRQWIELNSEGMRDREHPLEKPADVVRVAVLGDSYTLAFDVEREQAFWSVMERELAGCPALGGRRVEALNISKRGFGTTEELLALRAIGWKYDPDLVVLAFLSGNDLRNNSRALHDGDRPFFVHDAEGRLVLDESYADELGHRLGAGPVGDLWFGLVRESRLLQMLRRLRKVLKNAFEEREPETPAASGQLQGLDDAVYRAPADPAWQSAWRVTEDVVALLGREVRERGAELLVMTLSNAIQVNPDPEVRRRYEAALGVPDLLYPDRRLEALAAREGLPFLMLVPPLRDHAESSGVCVHGFERAWPCQGHWNAEGHRVAGRLLAEKLCRELLPGLRAGAQ